MRTVEWAFFVAIAALLIPNQFVKSLFGAIAALAILAGGLLLLLDWRGAIAEFRAELNTRNYRLARVTREWPSYFWRAVGFSIVIVGSTVLAVGIVGLAG